MKDMKDGSQSLIQKRGGEKPEMSEEDKEAMKAKIEEKLENIFNHCDGGEDGGDGELTLDEAHQCLVAHLSSEDAQHEVEDPEAAATKFLDCAWPKDEEENPVDELDMQEFKKAAKVAHKKCMPKREKPEELIQEDGDQSHSGSGQGKAEKIFETCDADGNDALTRGEAKGCIVGHLEEKVGAEKAGKMAEKFLSCAWPEDAPQGGLDFAAFKAAAKNAKENCMPKRGEKPE